MPKVFFGGEELEFELEPSDSLTEREPDDNIAAWSAEDFKHEFESARFDRFLEHGKPLVVVNDAFRPTPTGQVLSQIKKWYPAFRGDYIVACGNHPEPKDFEVKAIFNGFTLPDDSRLFFHDSRKTEEMTSTGTLDDNEVLINKHVFDYPAVIIIGSVEPHYFAGFTGGRKALVPGLTDIESNRRNHALAVHAEAAPLKLAGNPVAEHLEKMLALVKLPNVFSIQVVCGRNQKILGCYCGDISDSFHQAVTLAEKIYAFNCRKQYDLVIAEMRPPLDRNLYQIQKAIENCAPAVKNEGTIVAVSKCAEGIGNDEFYQLAGKLENEEMVASYAELDNRPLGIHKLSRIVRLAGRINVKALTGLKREILEQVYIEPAVSIDAEIQKLKFGDRKQLDILLVRDAGLLAARLEI